MIISKDGKIVTTDKKILAGNGGINSSYISKIEEANQRSKNNKNEIEKIISGETPIGSIFSLSVDGKEIETDINGNIDLKLNSYLGATKIEYSTEKSEIILKDRNGKEISKTSLPLESILKTSKYNSITKEIELTFTNDIVIKIPMGDLISDVVTDQFLQKTGGTMSGNLDMDYSDITNTRLYDKETHNCIALYGIDNGALLFSSKSGALELRSPEMDDLDTSNFLIYPTPENTNHIAGQEYETYEWNLPRKSGELALKEEVLNYIYTIIVETTTLKEIYDLVKGKTSYLDGNGPSQYRGCISFISHAGNIFGVIYTDLISHKTHQGSVDITTTTFKSFVNDEDNVINKDLNCIKIGNTELTEEKLQQLLALLNK